MSNNTISIQGQTCAQHAQSHEAEADVDADADAADTRGHRTSTRTHAPHASSGHAGRGGTDSDSPHLAPPPSARILRSCYTLGKRIHSANQYPLKSGLDNHAFLNRRMLLNIFGSLFFFYFPPLILGITVRSSLFMTAGDKPRSTILYRLQNIYITNRRTKSSMETFLKYSHGHFFPLGIQRKCD